MVLRRARDILRTEGIAPLLMRSLARARSFLFVYVNCYLYEYKPVVRNEADFLPKVQDFTLKIISNNEEADELAKTTGFDIRRRFIDVRNRLNKGAIAFCIFVKGEFAYIGWVGMTEEAKRSLRQLPYKIDFSKGEAFSGGAWAEPKYRGMGLATYVCFRRDQFFISKGINIARDAIAIDNIAPQRALARFGAKPHAQGRYLRILRWEFWKEKPLVRDAD